ncbi:MAG TPA: flagellar hook assembly protein FlgD [Rhizomicrobium sp.]|jgi:flagellar basal-body rod modification protein FlgD|nr:flagellar hook assembly protein FlgD [Rhizomicrobium sp.]
MTTAVGSTPTTNPTATQDTSAQQQLAGNFNTFLQLLTTQLQNQDPLSPMDSNTFTQQLVEYSQVEQQIDTNTNLQTLIGQGSSGTGSYAVNYLGKAVTVANGQAPLADSSAIWAYNLGAAAANTTLTVTDANGNVVYTGAGDTPAGTHTFTWDGKGTDGNQEPDGTYKLTVGAAAADGTAVTSAVTSTGVVSEVDMTGASPVLMVGPMPVALSDIAGVQTL